MAIEKILDTGKGLVEKLRENVGFAKDVVKYNWENASKPEKLAFGMAAIGIGAVVAFTGYVASLDKIAINLENPFQDPYPRP